MAKRIIVSRIDNLGDVILTLPVCGAIKKYYDNKCEILFLGKEYTKSIIQTSEYVDKFISSDHIFSLPEQERTEYLKSLRVDTIIHVYPNKIISKLAKKAKIKTRIGTLRRFYNILNCNKRVNLPRKRSNLHEAQLNLSLLKPLGIKHKYIPDEIPELYGMSSDYKLRDEIKNHISESKMNIIFHPKSKGSAREWGVDNFSELTKLLTEDKFKIFVTGTVDEAKEMKEFLAENKENLTDLTGKLSLDELIAFISKADCLVAASTGPLHIASALGINTVGIYAPVRPIFPTRWAPIGKKASFLVKPSEYKNCKKCLNWTDCECIKEITPGEVYKKIIRFN